MKGAILMRTILAAMMLSLAAVGCAKEKPSPKTANPPPSTPRQAQGDIGDIGGHIVRGKQKLSDELELKNIGQLYIAYNLQRTGRASLKGFEDYIQRDAPKIYQALIEGRYIFIATDNPTSTQVLAYEKDIDLNGNRVVLFGDGHVETMKESALQAALKK
jgi:prepilin-type processing-associated H-X9-DG protein